MKTNNNNRENMNAATMASYNPEISAHVKMYADNTRELYDMQAATAEALAKKMARGETPDREQLTNCETLKRIARRAADIARRDEWCNPITPADLLQVRREIAAYILDELAPYRLEEMKKEAAEMVGTDDTMAAPTPDDWKKITLKADDPAAVCVLYCTTPDASPSFTAGWTDRAAALRWFEREKAAHKADKYTRIIEETPTRLVFEPKKGTAGRYTHELRDVVKPRPARLKSSADLYDQWNRIFDALALRDWDETRHYYTGEHEARFNLINEILERYQKNILRHFGRAEYLTNEQHRTKLGREIYAKK